MRESDGDRGVRDGFLRVLLVDDEPLITDFLPLLLPEHWEVETANDGQEAMERLAERPFDTVITDYRMPRGNGIWLLQRVRRLHPTVRRVLHTASYPEDVIAHLRSGLIDALLAKPVPLDALVRALAPAARGSRTGSETTAVPA
jgi:DNA-binding NtrC family response regulator